MSRQNYTIYDETRPYDIHQALAGRRSEVEELREYWADAANEPYIVDLANLERTWVMRGGHYGNLDLSGYGVPDGEQFANMRAGVWKSGIDAARQRAEQLKRVRRLLNTMGIAPDLLREALDAMDGAV